MNMNMNMNMFFKIQDYMKGIQYCGYKLSYDILIMGNRYIKGYGSTIFGYGLASFFLYGVTKELYFKYICKNSIDNDKNDNNDTNNDNKNKNYQRIKVVDLQTEVKELFELRKKEILGNL